MIDLQREYDSNNKKYWRGRLPHETVVEWSTKIPDGFHGGTYVHGMGVWHRGWGRRPKVHTIRIHERLSEDNFDCFAGETLLHEMVHLEAVLGDRYLLYHGSHFHKRMNRLANQAAFDPWW